MFRWISRTLCPAMVPVVLLMAVTAASGFGAEGVTADPGPASVLQRFLVSQSEAGGWELETIEIEASLPKLQKTARLRAIRRLLPLGQPNYKVLEATGDSLVRNQVIVRYISADEKATELAAQSVALTPANYKIHYLGADRMGDRLVYVYRMIPRRKREGLINGSLWIDSETGIAIREAGYLARSPSVFLKRVNLNRENELQNGTVALRITHVSVETRLIGRAQLVIVERQAAGAPYEQISTREGQ